MKTFLKSKTIWLQIISVLCLFIPGMKEWFAATPVEFVSVLAAVNVLVRFATSGKVTLFSDNSTGSAGTSAGMFLFVCATAAGLVGALPSCMTTVTNTTMPDGTVVEVKSKSSDPVAVKAACDLATEVLPLLDHLADRNGGQAATVIKQTDPTLDKPAAQ